MKSKFRTIILAVIIVVSLITNSENVFGQTDSVNAIFEILGVNLDDLCGDLLLMYAEKPDKLLIVDCKQKVKSETNNLFVKPYIRSTTNMLIA